MFQVVTKCNVFPRWERWDSSALTPPLGDGFQNFHLDSQHTNLRKPGGAFSGYTFSSTREVARGQGHPSPSPCARGTQVLSLRARGQGAEAPFCLTCSLSPGSQFLLVFAVFLVFQVFYFNACVSMCVSLCVHFSVSVFLCVWWVSVCLCFSGCVCASLCVCACVCLCMCVSVCACVSVSVCAHVCLYVFVSLSVCPCVCLLCLCMCVCVCLCVHVSVSLCVHMCVSMCLCLSVCPCVCLLCLCVSVCVCVCTCQCLCVCTCMSLCVCV